MSIIDRVRGAAYCNPPTLENTYALAHACVAGCVEGSFIECGVAAGAQIGIMADVALKEARGREVHLFDSFCGIPEAGPQDDVQPGIGACLNGEGRLVSSGVTVHGLASVQANMRAWKVANANLIYHEGWFQDTIAPAAATLKKIALLRLDGDLYESTLIPLQHFWPKLVSGGFLIIDDYALTGCRRAVTEYFGREIEVTPIVGGGGPVWLQKT